MFRIILAEVAADLAGAATGVLTTVQQSALALGVALLGALDAGLVSPLGFARRRRGHGRRERCDRRLRRGRGAVVAAAALSGGRLSPAWRRRR
jgi:hypothetical protein